MSYCSRMANRDNFRAFVVRKIAQRAGYRCSNPICLRPTIGSDGGSNTANIGVAAHITAAAEGGPRYEASFSPDERSAAENGIWLCQTCSRLIDADSGSFSEEKLREWKTLAEMRAYLGLRGLAVVAARSFEKLEAKIPHLVTEMRADLTKEPFIRVALVRWRKFTYNGTAQPSFIYYHEDHDHLRGKLKVMENYDAIINIDYGEVERFELTEEFVEYLELPV